MKTIFNKLLAFALMCAIACNVGCKDYDDDINAVNDRIDQLQGSIVLKTDFDSLKASVSALESSCVSEAELADALKAYAKPADITAALNAAQQAMDKAIGEIEDAIAALESSASKHQTADQVAATVENMLKSYKTWADVEAYIKQQISSIVTGLTEAEVKAMLAQYVETGDLHEAILGWTGDELKDFLTAEALKAYVTDEALVKALESYLTAEDIEDFLTEDAVKSLIAAADNSEALKEDIIEALTGEDGVVTIAVSDLKAAIDALVKRVDELEKKTKVQSIVWVPSTQNEVRYNYITLTDATVVRLAKEVVDEADTTKTNTVYTPFVVSNASATLKFKVTPAAAAKDITLENVSIDMQKVTRSEDAELFTITSVKGDESGILTVKVEAPDYDALKETLAYAVGAELPIISLNVSMDGVENCASNYIMVNSVQSQNIASLRYGNMVDGEFVQIAGGSVTDYYNNTNAITIFPAGQFYLYNSYSQVYHELPEGLEAEVKSHEVMTTLKPGTSSEFKAADHYTYGSNEAGYYIQLDGSKEFVGSNFMVGYDYILTGEDGTLKQGMTLRQLFIASMPTEGSLKGIEPYKISKVFDGTNNFLFPTGVTRNDVKKALWEANKDVYAPYGFNEASFGAAITMTAWETDSEYEFNPDFGLSEIIVRADGAANQAWVGKGVQTLNIVCELDGQKVSVPFEVELTLPEVTLNANGLYVVDGVAKANAAWVNGEYVVENKPITVAYSAATEAKNVVLSYTIGEDLTNFKGVAPEIVNGELVWNEWNGLSINVKVDAYLANNSSVSLASATFAVEIASPVGKLAAENAEVKSADPKDVTIAELFSLPMAGVGADKNVNILADAAYMSAVGGEIEYKVNIPADAASIVKNNSGVLTFASTSLQLQSDVNVEVVATFTDRFTGEEQTATSVVTLKK